LSPFTINLTDRIFSPSEISLLDRGLTFIPTVSRFPLRLFTTCHLRNIRNLMLRDFFQHSHKIYDPEAFQNMFISPSNWSPPLSRISPSTRKVIEHIDKFIINFISGRIIRIAGEPFIEASHGFSNNLSHEERISLQALSRDSSIIIKPADKGGSVVIMNRESYFSEARRQLDNLKYYQRIPKTLAGNNILMIKSILVDMFERGFISNKQLSYLMPSMPAHPRTFYLLPKVHKSRSKWPAYNMPEGRPIVSDCGSETYRVCELIDFFLKPLANKHSSYIQDTYDFVSKIRDHSISADSFLVTGDVTALYTNMNISRSLDIVRSIFSSVPDPLRPDSHILALLEICLRHNDFQFADEIFLQILGIAMGKAFAPNLANLYLLEFDKAAISGFSIKPSLYYRFIDDTFLIWPGSLQQLDSYQAFLNNIIPDIKITLISKQFITEFLDTLIYKHYSGNHALLKTRVFFKSTDTHQLLHGHSFHPKHSCRGVLKSQLIRFKRLCSNKSEYDHAARTLFHVLKGRGYARSLFRKLKRSVWLSNFSYTICRRPRSMTARLWPVIHHFDYVSASALHCTRKNLATLNIANSYKVLSAFKIHKNLSQFLTRSRFS
jgi:hypothetical protein